MFIFVKSSHSFLLSYHFCSKLEFLRPTHAYYFFLGSNNAGHVEKTSTFLKIGLAAIAEAIQFADFLSLIIGHAFICSNLFQIHTTRNFNFLYRDKRICCCWNVSKNGLEFCKRDIPKGSSKWWVKLLCKWSYFLPRASLVYLHHHDHPNSPALRLKSFFSLMSPNRTQLIINWLFLW